MHPPLQYNTIQVVKVRSRYLGLLHYGFMIAIALYISVSSTQLVAQAPHVSPVCP